MRGGTLVRDALPGETVTCITETTSHGERGVFIETNDGEYEYWVPYTLENGCRHYDLSGLIRYAREVGSVEFASKQQANRHNGDYDPSGDPISVPSTALPRSTQTPPEDGTNPHERVILRFESC